MVDEKEGGLEDAGVSQTSNQEGDKKAKVSSLLEHRLKKKKEKKEPPAKKVRIFQMLAAAINRTDIKYLPTFDTRYFVYQPEKGNRLVLIEGENQEVAFVNHHAVVHDLIRYTSTKLYDHDDYQLLHKEALEAVAYWMAHTEPLAQPSAVGWYGESWHTFRRLPWALDASGECPTWETLLGRMSNSLAFCHWLGGLFFEKSSMHQYAWIYGDGNDGKGAINRFLARVFGPAYCPKQPPHQGDKFWAYGLMGKKIVVFPDCNDQRFVTTSLFKAWTGGDLIDVEAKGRMSFSFQPTCKPLFFSNFKPNVTGEKSDKRRIIYCEFEPRAVEDQDDPVFEDKLWAEGGVFLSLCREGYQKAYPEHGQIQVETERLDEWLEVQEEKFDAILDQNFYLSFDEIDKDKWCSGHEFSLGVVKDLRRPNDVDQFRRWLARKHGVKKQSVRLGTNTSKKYKGLVLKTALSRVLTTAVHERPRYED